MLIHKRYHGLINTEKHEHLNTYQLEIGLSRFSLGWPWQEKQSMTGKACKPSMNTCCHFFLQGFQLCLEKNRVFLVDIYVISHVSYFLRSGNISVTHCINSKNQLAS